MPHNFFITIIASRRFTSYTVLIISWPWWFKFALLLLSNRLSNVSLKSVTWIRLYFPAIFHLTQLWRKGLAEIRGKYYRGPEPSFNAQVRIVFIKIKDLFTIDVESG